MRPLRCAWLALVVACVPEIPAGELVCTLDAECPPDWICHRDGRCYEEPRGDVRCGREAAIAEVLPVPEGIARKLDVLFVIDDSNADGLHQDRLAAQIPGWIDALVSGDLDEDGAAELVPIESIHFGVTTTNMGTEPFVVPTCAGSGQDGELLTSGIQPECARSYPRVLEFEASSGQSPESIANDLGCLMRRTGAPGCAFEQPFEAMLKALTPSTSAIEFLSGTGHADGANAGFLREDSVLAIVMLTSENDCSARNREIYSSTGRFGGELNLRCAQYEEQLFDVQRYVDGLLEVRPDTSRLVLTFLVGIPENTGPVFADSAAYDALLVDPRMEETPDPGSPSRLIPLCRLAEAAEVFPGRRFLELGRALQAAGATVAVPSLCDPLEGALDAVLTALQDSLIPDCVSTAAVEAGRCEVVDPLPAGRSCREVGLALAWAEADREVCRIPFSSVADAPSTAGPGWYLDSSSDLCARNEGLVRGFDIDLDVDVTIQCEDPDRPTLGEPCTVGGEDCVDTETPMDCDPESFTCQRQCRQHDDCGAGFECFGLSERPVGVCSNPTCASGT